MHIYTHKRQPSQAKWYGLHKTIIKIFYIPVKILPTPVNRWDFDGQGRIALTNIRNIDIDILL